MTLQRALNIPHSLVDRFWRIYNYKRGSFKCYLARKPLLLTYSIKYHNCMLPQETMNEITGNVWMYKDLSFVATVRKYQPIKLLPVSLGNIKSATSCLHACLADHMAVNTASFTSFRLALPAGIK